MIILFPLVALAKEVWTIPVMNCQGCEEKIQTVIDEFKISDQVELIDYKSRTVCFQVAPPEEISPKLEEELKAQKYIVSEKKVMDSCFQEIRDPWEDTRGDFQIISKGQRVSIKKHRVKGKYTIIDFSAVWCSPCYDISNRLKPILEQREDVAVRAIELPDNQEIAFDAPVVFQHMSQAEGLPYMILFDKRGKKLYEGSDLDELLRYIEQ